MIEKWAVIDRIVPIGGRALTGQVPDGLGMDGFIVMEGLVAKPPEA